MDPKPPILTGGDPLGWREEFRRALAQPELADLGADPPWAPEETRRAAYRLATCLGHCRLFGVDLDDLDGSLPPKVAKAATEQWSAHLDDWLRLADQLDRVWVEVSEEVEAMDASVDLLTARMESWAIFLAVDEAYQDSLELGFPDQKQFAVALRTALNRLDLFDNALHGKAAYLAPVADTQLLSNWRVLLDAEYRSLPPWWLDGTLERLSTQAQENVSTWLPRVLPEDRLVASATQLTGIIHETKNTAASELLHAFAPGQIVRLRSDPNVVGAVVELVRGVGEARYVVFWNGRTIQYYASQLEPVPTEERAAELSSLHEFDASLTALHLQQPGLSSLYSLHAARIDFIPYQFRPVLKFIRSDRPRLLIADSVGVGKTIEAGLILRELQARREVRNILIVCPKSLVVERKWESEMRRFDEEFIPLDGKTLQHCLRETDSNGEWPERFARTILPFSLFSEGLLHGNVIERRSRVPGLLQLDPPPRFDLIIVDEAHHLHNPDTYLHQGIRFLSEHAEAVVFLTASPIQLGSDNLFILLNLLRPDLVIDRKTYDDMAEPNPYINRAAHLLRFGENGWQREAAESLDKAGGTRWGRSILRQDPRYLELRQTLLGEDLQPAERVRSLRAVEKLHTFHGLINRTLRRDIGNFTIRKAYTKSISFTEPQRLLHDRVLDTQALLLRRSHGDSSVSFLMSTIRRQVASCIHGLVPFLRDILVRHVEEAEWYEMDDDFAAAVRDPTAIRTEIDRLIMEAANLDMDDPKLDCLTGIIREKQGNDKNKVLTFSSFRHTLRYLESNLLRKGIRVGLIHGGVADDDRVAIRDRFRLPKGDPDAFDVLLMSEVGSEGLDYQFCDCLVNYDLPWNPMKIDQRIGRIDRHGQTSETIAIYNLITPGTVDADIYERCLQRIGVFEQALGDNEEILGRLTSEIRSLAEDLTLTAEERRRHLQQLADNEVRLLEEQADLEKRQSELFGVQLPPAQIAEEIHDPRNYWTSPRCLQNMVEQYVTKRSTGKSKATLGDKPLNSLTLDPATRRKLLDDYRLAGRRTSAVSREWEKWLKGRERLSITFDAGTANEQRTATFITPVHPLAQQAAQAMAPKGPVYLSCRVRAPGYPTGAHRFAIYLWQLRGIREDVMWQPVCSEASLTEDFLSLLHKAEFPDGPPADFPLTQEFDALDVEHHRLWSRALAAHRERTFQLASYLRESLRTSHNARLGLLNDQLRGVSDERIRRMRLSQIQAAEDDYTRRLMELGEAETTADIIARPVAFGLVELS